MLINTDDGIDINRLDRYIYEDERRTEINKGLKVDGYKRKDETRIPFRGANVGL